MTSKPDKSKKLHELTATELAEMFCDRLEEGGNGDEFKGEIGRRSWVAQALWNRVLERRGFPRQ
jgi:hypothetical protein